MTAQQDGAGTGGEMAADQVSLDHDLLTDRISRLIDLYDEMDAVRSEIEAVQGRQGSYVWSAEPSVQRFRSAYVSQLDALLATLGKVQQHIDTMRTALADSQRALLSQDEAAAELFDSLVDKLDGAGAPAGPPGQVFG
ncbi:hypothetical protein [Cellulomonas composti]|uniref:Uncharacterized protein n=1 Tax=Cellulomonas composti TaxID=266130 RepID=A0A511JE98_9CELL|nr:hypothetical protein [Cellulomonas composti]GEL96318.1 hypothetical protein CCO02nite_29760 [Cellulomonas composti]